MFKSMMIALLFAGVAHAGTAFNFSPATDGSYHCGGATLCTGFATDSANTVEYVNITQTRAVTISVDGVVYKGTTPATGEQFTAMAADGGYRLVSVTYASRRTCTGSGRGSHCTTYNIANGGAVQ